MYSDVFAILSYPELQRDPYNKTKACKIKCFPQLVKEHPKALDYIDGIAVHYYGDYISPASILSEAVKNYPGKFVIATEACEGTMIQRIYRLKRMYEVF